MDNNCLVRRNPIFRSRVDVAAYQLHSYLANPHGEFTPAETARAIFSMFTESGLEQILGGRKGYIDVTPEVLQEGLCKTLPVSRIVIGYFEDFAPTDELARQLATLAADGFRIVVSDKLRPESLEVLADWIQAIKVDVTCYSPDELQNRIKDLRRYKSQILADNVATYDDLEYCRSLGFDLYSGRFLSKPAAQGEKVPTNRLAMIRLLAALQNPDISMANLEKAISADLALSYKLLRYTNSAALALPRTVNSIGHALRLIGTRLLRSWASALLLSSVDNKPRELMTQALIRARVCEQLAETIKNAEKDSFQLAGMLSVLDALMDCPLDAVLTELPLSDDIRNALTQRTGPIGQALRCAIAYEQADWEEVQFYGLSHAEIRKIYLEAIAWAQGLTVSLLN